MTRKSPALRATFASLVSRGYSLKMRLKSKTLGTHLSAWCLQWMTRLSVASEKKLTRLFSSHAIFSTWVTRGYRAVVADQVVQNRGLLQVVDQDLALRGQQTHDRQAV